MATTLLGQITEDLAGKYNATFGFAESVTGPSGAFLAIFSNEYYQSDPGGYAGASSSTPVLRCRDADSVAKGGALVLRGSNYIVVEVMPNGYGETIHRLQYLSQVVNGTGGIGVDNLVLETSLGENQDNLLIESGVASVMILEA